MTSSTGFEELLEDGFEKLGLRLDGRSKERLSTHHRLLDKWSRRVNLTAVTGLDGVVERLYLDSAVLIHHLGGDARLHDVGTGAGFPGLVLKALRPEMPVVLTEARRKKVSFLKQAARQMGLVKDLEIRHRRLGWNDVDENERWSEVVSKAAFPPIEWIRYGTPLVEPGGRLWIFAGEDSSRVWPFDGEQQDAPVLPPHFSIDLVFAYQLPFSRRKRELIALRRDRKA